MSDETLCFCLGISRTQIENAPRASEQSIRKLIGTGDCACETLNPTGTCCLAAVRRVIASIGVEVSDQEEENPDDCCA